MIARSLHAWRRPLIGGLALVLGLGWWLQRPGPADGAPGRELAWSAPVLADGSVAGVPQTTPDDATTMAGDDPPVGEDCGWGAWRPAAVGVGAGLPTRAERQRITRDLLQQMGLGLQASGSLRGEAAGAWLMAVPVGLMEAGLRDCGAADCQLALRKTLRQMDRHAEARNAARQGLVERAFASSDPAVVALGLAACEQGEVDSGCAAPLAGLWTDLEPDNAAAWLTLARVAAGRGDRAAEAQAMHNASVAPRYQAPGQWLMAEVLRAMPPGMAGGPRSALLTSAATAAGAVTTPAGAALPYCREAAQAAGRATCAALAELLLAQARSATDLLFAIALARQAGLPEARLGLLETELDTLRVRQQALERAASSDDATACEASTAWGAYLQRQTRHGELAALRGLPQP